MAYTADHIIPGLVFPAKNQGTAITPQTAQVKVHWVGPDAVHYYLNDDPKLKETSLDRFLSIINQ